MKRQQIDRAEATSGQKQRRLEEKPEEKGAAGCCSSEDAAALLQPHMADLDGIQAELQKLEEECAKQQMLVQKEFDEKKKPVLVKRQEIIDKIPGFWCRCLRNHPQLAYLVEEDIPVLEHLKRIDLDDNIDEHGSYKIKFTFDEGAKAFMEPLVLEKHVQFRNDPCCEEVVSVTEITWKDGKSPVAAAEARRAENGDEDVDVVSFFEWFTKESSDVASGVEVGEIIRREIWHAPVPYFLDEVADIDDEDDDDELSDDDEDDEDGSDNANEEDGGEDDEE
ncbi:putative nucleosome assembly protein (NAP) [Besnoitia besnoiti]|uniref:Putative nucleosome assembly protein (NAP) n=1 Tax=Besnoitia besnoiti TaxID=94643 RepID=A0A2A9M8E3_BESBE|nr:putative nucleosome assembly protein (NAP) [Besnoitia besnoiti]PFH32186.1 putative nucleosome assembly protein (NAP) [Besnoitia besnoiti]